MRKLAQKHWLNFDDKFPIVGQKIKIKVLVKPDNFTEKTFVSDEFNWSIPEEGKEQWLLSGLSKNYSPDSKVVVGWRSRD